MNSNIEAENTSATTERGGSPSAICSPLKEGELRALATCACCSRKIGETRNPMFWKVTMEHHIVNIGAVQRQQGLTMMLGGSAMIAGVMGPDEDMTTGLEKVTVMICQDCSTRDIMLAAIAETAANAVALPTASDDFMKHDNQTSSRCLHPVCSALRASWLTSEPEPAHDQTDAGIPESDDDGCLAKFSKPVDAVRAAEFTVEVSDRQMSDGEEFSVWVWEPEQISSKQLVIVSVGLTWSFVGRPNDLRQARAAQGVDDTAD